MCKMFVAGYVAELKRHFREVHLLNTSKPAKVPFVCSECGSIYRRFTALKRHIISLHPPKVDARQEDKLRVASGGAIDSVCLSSDVPDAEHSGIPIDKFSTTTVTPEQLKTAAADFITKMRCDVSIPESRILEFMEAADQLHEQHEIYSVGVFKEFLRAKSIPFDDKDAVEAMNKLSLNSLFSDVRTPEDSLAHLSKASKYAIPIPKEVMLGRTKVTRVTNRPAKVEGRRLQPKQTVNKIKVVKHVAHYVPIKDTLALIVQNRKARDMIQKENNDGVLRGFKDGTRFQEHPFLSSFPTAIRLSLHLDDVEHNNPLGSRKGIKKMTVFSFKIENFDSIVNSDLSRIYLALIVASKDLKKYGHEKVLQPLIEDLRQLESDSGITIKIGEGDDFVLRAVLVHVIGDTLAIHDIFRLMGPQARMFCRFCYMPRDALRRGCPQDSFPCRTPESVKCDLAAIQSKQQQPSDLGIVGDCVFHQLKYFNIATNNTMDPMHDLLEGVVPKVIKLVMNDLINNRKLISIDEVNSIITNFNYGTAESRDKPSSNFSAKSLKPPGYSLAQSAAQTWTLLRAFPFMFKKILFCNPNYLTLIGSLLKIVYVAFSNRISQQQITELDQEVTNFHNLFRICFPYVNFINKMHHLVHYSTIIRNDGPIVNFSCMLFEGKFKETKRQTKTCNNFVNLSLSLVKRFNLRQVQAILNHSYEIDAVVIISSVCIPKVSSNYSLMLYDFPDSVTVVRHMKINGTSFRPDLIVRYKMCGEMFYGETKEIISSNDVVVCLVEELNCEAFYEEYNSFKVLHTGRIIRITTDKLSTRKTYSFWQFQDEDGFYISLKYNDE